MKQKKASPAKKAAKPAARAPNQRPTGRARTPTARTHARKPSPARKTPAARKAANRAVSPHKIISDTLGSAAVRRKLIDNAGENAIDVMRAFEKSMSDEEIARRTHLRVSEVRAVLNRLHSHGLAVYTRKRDSDSGWYSYVWHLNYENCRALLTSETTLKQRTTAAQETAGQAADAPEKYYCPNCGENQQYLFENAVDLAFKCPNCGDAMAYCEKK